MTPRTAWKGVVAGASGYPVARVNAIPADGARNAAVIALVARTFGDARCDVAIVGGHTARVERLRIDGHAAALAKAAVAL